MSQATLAAVTISTMFRTKWQRKNTLHTSHADILQGIIYISYAKTNQAGDQNKRQKPLLKQKGMM